MTDAALMDAHCIHDMPWYDCPDCSQGPEPGVWMVFGTGEPMPYPLYLGKDMEDAHRYVFDVAALGVATEVKFWLFGDEFGTR